MIEKVIAIVILALITLYIASYLHLLSFASLVPYGRPYVPPMPANVSTQSIVHFITQAFSS